MADNFLEVARERGVDASTLKREKRFLAATYMAGYAVECGLKALLQRTGKRFPTSGSEGHHLRGLWEAAGLKLDDIHGYSRLFMDVWTTTLRYEHSLPDGMDFESLYQGSIDLIGYIQKRIRGSKDKRLL
jgi:hypothetical protein